MTIQTAVLELWQMGQPKLQGSSEAKKKIKKKAGTSCGCGWKGGDSDTQLSVQIFAWMNLNSFISLVPGGTLGSPSVWSLGEYRIKSHPLDLFNTKLNE